MSALDLIFILLITIIIANSSAVSIITFTKTLLRLTTTITTTIIMIMIIIIFINIIMMIDHVMIIHICDGFRSYKTVIHIILRFISIANLYILVHCLFGVFE